MRRPVTTRRGRPVPLPPHRREGRPARRPRRRPRRSPCVRTASTTSAWRRRAAPAATGVAGRPAASRGRQPRSPPTTPQSPRRRPAPAASTAATPNQTTPPREASDRASAVPRPARPSGRAVASTPVSADRPNRVSAPRPHRHPLVMPALRCPKRISVRAEAPGRDVNEGGLAVGRPPAVRPVAVGWRRRRRRRRRAARAPPPAGRAGGTARRR